MHFATSSVISGWGGRIAAEAPAPPAAAHVMAVMQLLQNKITIQGPSGFSSRALAVKEIRFSDAAEHCKIIRRDSFFFLIGA